MASSRSRQRRLARERYDRQMARRAAAARRRRQIQAAVGASLALVLIVVGAVWVFGGFSGEEKPAAAPDTCIWTPQNASANANLKNVGLPPVNPPTSGTADMMLSTNQGVIHVALDVAAAPCATASLTYLANVGFYGNTECHELLTGDHATYALRCGDPSGTGSGGPTYTFYDENVPTAPTPDPSASTSAAPGKPLYAKGTVSMATDTPGANGSQFFIFYQDSHPDLQYSVVGTVSSGLDVVEKIAKAGTVDNGSGAKTKPKLGVKIQNLTVTGPASPSTAPGAASAVPSAAPASGAAAGSGSPSASS